MNFERVLQKVLWCLVTEGSISYRRIKLSFGLDKDGLEELRRERSLAGGARRVAALRKRSGVRCLRGAPLPGIHSTVE